MNEIKDTEIRFIGDDHTYDGTRLPSEVSRLPKLAMASSEAEPKPLPSNKAAPSSRTHPKYLYIVVIVLLLVVASIPFLSRCSSILEQDSPVSEVRHEDATPVVTDDIIEAQFEPETQPTDASSFDQVLLVATDTLQSACYVRNVEVNGIPFRVLLPSGATPELHIGRLDQRDPTIVLALQAADIRKDNGQIVGACVHHGNPVSKGLAKKGFVAIINGQITVGVSDTSPLYERAVQSDGDFFRQYPLVDRGQLVENNPKNLSIRRGLCQRQDETFAIESLVPISFHDFSQALVDMQVRDAVYLVGSQYACGMMRDSTQTLTTWGESKYSRAKNISYLVWRAK